MASEQLWTITGKAREFNPLGSPFRAEGDARAFAFQLANEASKTGTVVAVFLQQSALEVVSGGGTLPDEVARAIRTNGRAAVEGVLHEIEPPRVLRVTVARVVTGG